MNRLLITLVVLLTLTVDMASLEDPGDSPKSVLAFGGNGFIGSELVTQLLDRNYKVTVVSRGNWYFDSAKRIQPRVQHIVCDREDSDFDFCTELVNFINDTKKFDLILDFSAYRPGVIQSALEYLTPDKVGLYFYISTDSVYEVSKRKPDDFGGTVNVEEDAVRPEDPEEREHFNELDSYGNEKLGGEEVLRAAHEKTGLNYLIFRLPDVIGPRDTTDRWWTYQMWIQFYRAIQIPLFIPPDVAHLRTSYVYVKDIAQAFLKALDAGPSVWNQVYNLGLDRSFTLEEFLQDLAAAVNPPSKGSKESESLGVDFNYESSDRSFNLFPSVTRGSVNINKAKEVLGFVPTPWEDVLKETVAFYRDGFFTFKSERDDVVHQITRYVLPRDRKGGFLQLIDQIDRGGFQQGTKEEL